MHIIDKGKHTIVNTLDNNQLVKTMSVDVRIRKVKVLQGRPKEEAEKKKLNPDDLVIVTTSVNSLPEYKIEKIDGDPVSFLLKRSK